MTTRGDGPRIKRELREAASMARRTERLHREARELLATFDAESQAKLMRAYPELFRDA